MPEKQYEILALTLRYWFIALIGYIFFQSLRATFKARWEKQIEKDKPERSIPVLLALLNISAFVLLGLRSSEGFDTKVAILGILAATILLFQYYLLGLVFSYMDKPLLLMVNTLGTIGFIMLQRLNPELAFRQVEWFGLGSIALLFFVVIINNWTFGEKRALMLQWVLMGLGCLLLIAPIVFGREIFGAKNWISVAGYNMQPSEFVKIILIFVLTIGLQYKKTFMERLSVFIFTAVAVLLVVIQKDLGAALLYFSLFAFMYYIATSDLMVTIGSLIMAALGAIISYKLFNHVRVRVEAWKNPWADIEDKGYQIVQSLIAISSGGLVGAGLGLGSPYVVPAAKTDFIFSAICEEMGILAGFFVIGLYALIMLRGVRIALKSRTSFDALLSMGAVVTLSIQSFIIIGGVIKLIPLTGITMPFVSYGGSSMIVSLCLIGILEGVAVKTEKELKREEQEKDKEDRDELIQEEQYYESDEAD